MFLDDDAGNLHTTTQHILLESEGRIEGRLTKGGERNSVISDQQGNMKLNPLCKNT